MTDESALRGCRVAIAGAGLAGLQISDHLKRRGIDYTVYEKAEEVGGTWRDNTFPGLFVDLLSRQYEFPFAPMVFDINLDRILGRVLPQFEDFSRQPVVRRDISIEISEKVSAQAMLDALWKSAGELVCNIALFDVYRGKGIDSDKKSIAFKVVLQDTRKTLTDSDVEAAIQRLIQVLQEEFQAKLRK